MPRPRTALALAVLAAVLASAAAPVAGATVQQGADGVEDPLRADATVVEVHVLENGSAEWSVQYRYRLHTENRTRGFARLQHRVREDPAYAAEVRRDYRAAARVASNRTGREMAVSDVSVEATRHRIPQDNGVVVHEFVWHGFAASDGSRLAAGDAITGLWLRPDSRFTVTWPASYSPESVDPDPDDFDDREATWVGPAFGPDEPRVVLTRDTGSSAGYLLPAVALLTVLAALAVARYRSQLPAELPRPAHHAAAGAARSDAPSDGAATAAGDGESAAAAPAPSTDSDEAPLSNEEQLRRVLDRNDGRARQQTIADACGWSDSKTSRVVRSLEQEGTVDVYRIGRENVVSYPEVDVSDA